MPTQIFDYITTTTTIKNAICQSLLLLHHYIKAIVISHKARRISRIGLLQGLFLLTFYAAESQPYIGQVEITNFKKNQYHAGTQNWMIRSDNLGRVYFANNEGLLSFDGGYWKLFPLPNKTIVRSIEFGKDNLLYAGGQDELGYFSPNQKGVLTFTSLKPLMETSDQQFADIWNIVAYENSIFFRSKAKLFQYKNNKITVYQPWSSWNFIGMHQQQLIAHDESKGIIAFNQGSWETLIDKAQLPKGFYITSITPFENKSLLTTSKDGIFLLDGNQLKPFILTGTGINNKEFFTTAIKINDSNYLLGTYNSGIYHINQKGKLVEIFSKQQGLQNNNVQAIFCTPNQNIWVGLNDGVAFFPYNSPIIQINPAIFNDGSGYAVAKHQNNIFFALSNGVYTLPIENTNHFGYAQNNIKKIAEGLSWNLSALDGQVLAGKENGFFSIKNNQLYPIDNSIGYWTFEADQKHSLVAGTYLGIAIFEQQNGQFTNKKNLPKFNTSARFLAVDTAKNDIWVSHPYRGIYKIKMAANADSIALYTAANGLPSTLNNHVFKIKNKIVVATDKGIYEYNPLLNSFQTSDYYKNIFQDLSIKYLKEDLLGNLWFVHEKSLGVVDFSAKNPAIYYIPSLQGKILSGFEHIYPLDSSNIVVGGERGFYNINYQKFKQNNKPLTVFITAMKAINDNENVLFGGYFQTVNQTEIQTKASIPTLNYKWNAVHFEYASPYNYADQQANLEYACYLEGFDNNWSAWSKKMDKDYTNLPPGNYTFQVKARNGLNDISAISSFSFYIETPWYRTVLAWLGYVVLFLYLLYLFIKTQTKKAKKKHEEKLLEAKQKYEAAQKNIAYAHQIALEKSEKKLIQLKNEKLETEIEHKNSELASAAISLIQKKEFLVKIKEELNRLNKSEKKNLDSGELKKILRSITEDNNFNQEWEQFSIHFNKVHSNFLVTMKEKFPQLNPHDLKLCAYLIMNLSSKEIAHLMSISVRGVEISRYRLRKKLNIDKATNLFQFLFEIEMANRKEGG